MKKLCGYDVNGWRDIAARDWQVLPGGEEEHGGWFHVASGLLPSIVRAGGDAGDRWIGGAQAALAPHGRNAGWGAVGESGRRELLCDLLLEETTAEDKLAAALTGLVTGPDHGVLAIDDVPRVSELHQERLISALRRARVRSHLLVWRPVLAALDAIRQGLVLEGQRVGVLCHDREGFALQTLRIRRDAGRTKTVLAPERRKAGVLVASDSGYAGLIALAEHAVADALGDPRTVSRLERPRAIARLAFGERAPREILRAANGDWQVLDPPGDLDLPTMHLDAATVAMLETCDTLLFESLTTGPVHSKLLADLSALLSSPLQSLPQSSVADGALEAALRLSRRDPVYFDFLPQISTIVQTRDGAKSYDLITDDETLPAGRLYRSRQPARLGLQAGQDRIAVHLRKETMEWPRRALVDLGTSLTSEAPVDIWVEQAPAAGRAKILLQSPALSRTHVVDWDAAEKLDTPWQELIDDLEMPLPTIPERLILPCGMQAWEDNRRGDGLLTLLAKNDGRRNVDWDSLATRLAQRPFGRYCVSSDGGLPDDVPEEAVYRLERLTERACAEALDRIEDRTDDETGPLKFLTWQFRRCPIEIADAVLALLKADDRQHELLRHPARRKLLFQGLGRITTEAREKETFATLLTTPPAQWVWDRDTACAAFLLSRSDTAPQEIARGDVEHLADRAVDEFVDSLGTEYTRFFYAPFLMVGLLRWRKIEPRALVAGLDPVATRMRDAVDRTLPDIERKARRKPSLLKYVAILRDMQMELEGQGENPELLLDIYGRGEDR